MRNAGGGRRTGLRRGGLFHVSNRHRRRSFGFLGLDLPRCILLLAAALCIIGGAINVWYVAIDVVAIDMVMPFWPMGRPTKDTYYQARAKGTPSP